MKKYIPCIMAASAIAASAGVNTGRLNISRLSVLRSDNSLTVNMSVNTEDWKVKSDSKVILTPAVIAGTDTVRLDPITIAGKRAWFYEIRNGNTSTILEKAGKPAASTYSRTIDFEPWMETSSLQILVDTVS
ncbi:MAG: DUF3868 domain-containing protein, partial [Muribaculaceae bacterium]|nr:DUF3868 domain-containing protein [Muribaculaceae bacterium]